MTVFQNIKETIKTIFVPNPTYPTIQDINPK